MIQKFRWRFIFVSICSLLIILLFSIGGLVGLSFSRNHAEAQKAMTALVKNDGDMDPRSSRQFDRQAAHFLTGHPNPEQAYQYRYFRVLLTHGGAVVTNQPQNFTLSKQKIKQTVAAIAARKSRQGRVWFDGNAYQYQRYQNPAGQQAIIFLNTSLIYLHSRFLLRLGLLLGFLALLIFTLILIGLSNLAIRPISQAYHQQQLFITNAGHELKTPLAIIAANTEMEELSGKSSQWTKSTQEQADRLTRLINRLLAIARLGESGELALSPVSFSKIVQEVVTSFIPVMQQKHLRFNYQLDPNLIVLAEPKSLRELVNIFLDNAQKYCDSHGLVTVFLHANKIKNQAILTFANTYAAGQGQNFAKFFERFYRADESHSQDKSGFGIGLSMAQELVEAFQGKIRVDYAAPTIKFTIALRLAKAAKASSSPN